MALLEREGAALPLSVQANLLSVSRASMYYQPAAASDAEIAAKRRIDEIYTARPFYGSRKIAVQMKREGIEVCRNTVAKFMRQMGIAAIFPGPNLSKRDRDHKVYPYLLRGMDVKQPNEVWGIDITYIRLNRGWMYLVHKCVNVVAVLDWYSRYVVSWELDQSLEMPFVLVAVDRALEVATPQIWNSDQGSHFTSPHYIERLLFHGVRISMDGKGRALDNVFMERLWRSVKYEEVYLHEYESPREARQGLTRYLDFYNQARLHQSLGYRTPAEVYFATDTSYSKP